MLYLKLGGGNRDSRIIVGMATFIGERYECFQDNQGDVYFSQTSDNDYRGWSAIEYDPRILELFRNGHPLHYCEQDNLVYIYVRASGELGEAIETTEA